MKDIDTYGLIGYPLGHSFSRNYFNEKFDREGINAQYVNFEVPEIGMLPRVLGDNKNLKGLNVTIPYKQSVIAFLDVIDEEAQQIGAVNTVKVGDNGVLKGFNTDVYGFVESLKPLISGDKHSRALVLGTGGASKAVCFGLKQLDIEVTNVSRQGRPEVMSYGELTENIVNEHTVIVNTTPLGMYPKVSECPLIPYEGIGDKHVCFDLIYNPSETLFMKLAAERGAKVSNGLKMLHLQAERAWQIWNEK